MILLDSMWHNMFSLGMDPWEKVLRTVLVYAGIAVIIRLIGKRLMSQMNSLDLVVVLLLSNVVQNAIIGDDNSITGGLLGAAVLVLFNWIMDMLEFRIPGVRAAVEGKDVTIIQDGQLDERELRHLGLTDQEVNNALKLQGADHVGEVKRATIEPGGSIVVDLYPGKQAAAVDDLRAQIAQLQAHLDARLDAIESAGPGSRRATGPDA